MLRVLASGVLVRDPQSRTGANGRAYATGLLRVPSEDAEAMLLSIVCFSDSAVAALLALATGDACAVAGRAKISEWTNKEGAQKHGLSVVADQMLTMYSIEKRRRQTRQSEEAPV
jgi:single-stranded DNA-binding protein